MTSSADCHDDRENAAVVDYQRRQPLAAFYLLTSLSSALRVQMEIKQTSKQWAESRGAAILGQNKESMFFGHIEQQSSELESDADELLDGLMGEGGD